MAASAYASLVSLLNTMDQIQFHPRLSTCFDNYQFQSLRKMVDFLVNFVESYSEAEDLVKRIGDAAHETENKIEAEAADRIRGASTRKSLTMLVHLQKIIQDMDSIIKEEVIKMKEEIGLKNSMPPPPPPSSSSSVPPATKKTTMVGFGHHLTLLLDKLTALHSGQRIFQIVGMGGIGKTTLARNVYENSIMAHHFDVRAWVTVSQEYNAREILLQALRCLGVPKSEEDGSDGDLGLRLRNILYNRRYLIVLDDVWSVDVWEKIQFYFPENDNGSRIVVTTRQQQLVDYFGSSALALDFLDDKHSWELFCDKAFRQEGCPTELEEVGRKIVKKCKGLPLAISVVGGLLSKSPRTLQYWEKIANDKSLVVEYSGEGNEPLSILYSSYKHLPVYLKPCFLHLGLFPEDHVIHVSLLIKLWVGEGFIKPNTNQSLEEVAESYIKELVDRNLLLVPQPRRNKKLETCFVHDLVRELCIRMAEKEDFYYVQRDIAGRRLVIVDERSFYPQQSLTSVRPLLMDPLIFDGQVDAPFKSRLLRVFVGYESHLGPTFQEVNLRFLLLKSIPRFPPDILSPKSLCWSLQTLIVDQHIDAVASFEIWKMPQLRHIEMIGLNLPDPPPSEVVVLHNLLTLKAVHNLILTEEVCKRIPNLKDLEVIYDDEQSWCFHLQNVGCLSKLETLIYSFDGAECVVGDPLQNLKLPSSLKELNVWTSRIVQSDMAMIASLPHLETLVLYGTTVVGEEWNCGEEEFISLKHLQIQYCDDLINWIADAPNFPVLETLDLEDLSKLEEIPSGIGEIPTLERLCLYDCSESATISAIKILEEQESLGNEDLQLRLRFIDKSPTEMWREKIQELGFTSQNLHISCGY